MPCGPVSVVLVVSGRGSFFSSFLSCFSILTIGFFLTSVMSKSASMTILIFILLMLSTSWATGRVVGDLGTLPGGWLFYTDGLDLPLGSGTLLGNGSLGSA